MEEAKKSEFGDPIKELDSIICCQITNKERKSEKFAIDGDYKDLVNKMLDVPVGSNAREMFMLELLNNADVALHSVWCDSEVDKKKYGHPLCLGIGILPDENNQTLSIIDTGIGMTRDVLVRRLISLDRLRNSHLFRHIDNLKYLTCKANVDLPDLYKRDFELGFFSAYMVAYKVVITTKQEGHDPYVWEFDASDKGAGGSAFSFSIAPAAASPGFHRGTKVTLHLKDGYREFLRVDKLKELVNKCTQETYFYPIFIILYNNENSRPVFRRLNEEKEEKVPIQILKEKYKGVQEAFFELIRDMGKKADVVISDRARRVFCNLDVFGNPGKPVLEINPRFSDIEEFTKLLESVKSYNKKLKRAVSLPKDEEKENKLTRYKKIKKKKKAALKSKICERFYLSLLKFQCYDTLNQTSFYHDAVEATTCQDDGCWMFKP